MYYVYMLRCSDNSIYTGITNDIERRLKEHFNKDKKCAKYTKRHNANKLEALWQTENRSLASKLEIRIKSLNKEQKEKIILNNNLNDYFLENLEIEKYERLKI